MSLSEEVILSNGTRSLSLFCHSANIEKAVKDSVMLPGIIFVRFEIIRNEKLSMKNIKDLILKKI